MQLKEDIVNYGHGLNNQASYLAVHETANPGASAWNHRNLYARGDWPYAVQYVCDWTGDVYHTVPDNCLAWAVGSGNRYCVNLEICHATSQENFEKAWRTAVEFCAWYLKARGWTIDKMISHDDARRIWGGTDHTDPIGYFKKYGKSWQQFKDEVYAAMNDTPQYNIGGSDRMKRVSIPNGPCDVYRVYNPNAGDHHYTPFFSEVESLVSVGWKDEGIAWRSPDTGNVVYRVYNQNAGDHFLTISFGEVQSLEEAGWICEGCNFSSAREDDPKAIPVYRLYNPNAGDHHYTTSESERDSLKNAGWRYEGVAFFAISE